MNNGFIVSQKSNDNIEVVPAGLEVGYLMKYQKWHSWIVKQESLQKSFKMIY